MQDESYTQPASYTPSYTGNPQCIKGISRISVGMYEKNTKLFLEKSVGAASFKDLGN